MKRVNGVSTTFNHSASDNTVYIAYLREDQNEGSADIKCTGDIQDDSQKNFEILVHSIGLRATPIWRNNPTYHKDLSKVGSTIKSSGYAWEFMTDVPLCFLDENNDKVGLLNKEINGIVLFSGSILSSIGDNKNIEFKVKE